MSDWQQQALAGVKRQVADFSIEAFVQIVLCLIIAAALGAVLGYERGRLGKAAGTRTHMLVCIGSALFVLIPQQSGMEIEALSRVIQGLLAGLGFLGAGAILKLEGEHRVQGLTTAASLWLTAAIGMTVGLGKSLSALLATLVALAILTLLPHISPEPHNGG